MLRAYPRRAGSARRPDPPRADALAAAQRLHGLGQQASSGRDAPWPEALGELGIQCGPVADCRAGWVDEVHERARVWELFRAAPLPLGHDPAAIWPAGPGGRDAGVLRLDPWRVRAARAAEIAAGAPAPAWRWTSG
jgi:hypothetical protein